jgi:SAM-dependent methyltransferase
VPSLPLEEMSEFLSSTGMEQPPCTICRVRDTVNFPWGGFHLNLLPPLAVVQCRRCGLFFLSPRPNEELRRALMQGAVPEAIQPYSDATANYAAVTTGRLELFRRRLRTLESLIGGANRSHPRRLLDIGASAGTFVQEARSCGWEAHGVEPSLTGTRAACELGLQLVQATAEALPIDEEAFDVVHSHHVFEHLTDPLSAAREAWRVLKPGGLLFIEVPNQFDNIVFRRNLWLRRIPRRQRNIRSIHHLWFFSRSTLPVLLRMADFTQIRVRDLHGRLPTGWRAPLTIATRAVGYFIFGGPLIQAYGRKPV